jgi:hypothetical protein
MADIGFDRRGEDGLNACVLGWTAHRAEREERETRCIF